MSKAKTGNSFWSSWKWLIEIVLFSVIAGLLIYAVPMEGLEFQGKVMLVMFLWCVALWIAKPLEEWLVSVIACVILVIFFGIDHKGLLSGFQNPGWFLVIFSQMIGITMVMTGLGRRMAYFIVSKLGKGGALMANYAVGATTALCTLIIPSAGARTSTLVNIVDELSESLGFKRGERGGESLVMTGMFVNTTGTIMFLTGTNTIPMGLAIVMEATGRTMSWGEWFAAGFLPGAICCLLIPMYTHLLYKPKKSKTGSPAEPKKIDVSFAKQALAEMGPMSTGEKWSLICFSLTVLLWATGSLTGINANIVPWLTVFLLLIPNFAPGTSKEIIREVPWSAMLWIGLAMGMANNVNSSGGFQWLVDTFFTSNAAVQSLSYTGFLIVWLLLVLFIHIIFAGMDPMVTLFTPIGMSIAAALGFDVFTVGVITIMAVCVGANFMAFNSQSNLLWCATNRFTPGQQLGAACLINVSVAVVLLLTLLFYWPLIGMV